MVHAVQAEFVICAYQPGDGEAFRRLNEEWIVRWFKLEDSDRRTLGDPEGEILSRGGHIFFAKEGAETLACVALIPADGGRFEVAKMAVSPEVRGRGIGRRLLEHTVAQARSFGAPSIFLGSSKKLSNAVHLYESIGFKHVPPEMLPIAYARADVFMEMRLDAE